MAAPRTDRQPERNNALRKKAAGMQGEARGRVLGRCPVRWGAHEVRSRPAEGGEGGEGSTEYRALPLARGPDPGRQLEAYRHRFFLDTHTYGKVQFIN